MPKVKPEDAASGRMEPESITSSVEADELKPGPSDVNGG
jgi:hypothetical protein